MNAALPFTDEQQQAALQWAVRLNDAPNAAERAAFERWLNADCAHAAAWAQTEALWQQAQAPAAHLAGEEAIALARYLKAMDVPPKRRRAPLAALAMAASVVLTVMVGAGWHPADWVDDLGADYVSAVGELRTVTLQDQSQLVLDADSAISVDFSHGQRQVTLRRGAVFFQVSHTGAPFIVQANGGTVSVLGTQFEVRGEDDGAQVTVLSGKVGVTAAPAQAQQLLTAGQQIAYQGGEIGELQGVNSESRLAWRQGWLNYYQAPLSQVVEDLSRYYPGRIVLLGADLGQRKVSGSFPTNDPLAALDALGAVVGFKRQTLLGRLTVVR